MAPLRRYLRITPYSVLEVRIYLDTPSDLHRWLLHPNPQPSSTSTSTTSSAPVLPRIISAVRPLILPKLREETETSKKGPGKRKRGGWKDTVVGEDFEVAIFLTETSARHAILRREKFARGEKTRELGTLGGRMTGSEGAPVEIGGEDEDEDEDEVSRVGVRKRVRVRREESGDGDGDGSTVALADVPLADIPQVRDQDQNKEEGQRGGEDLFISDNEGDDEEANTPARAIGASGQAGEEEEDKKKLRLNTTYDGFSIYGRILCLVVKRRGGGSTAKKKEPAGPAMMEEWISSTQMGGEGAMMDE